MWRPNPCPPCPRPLFPSVYRSNLGATGTCARVYLHEEGLCRLATEPYSADVSSFGNRFMHLTNYSINRKSSRYEPGSTPDG